MGCGAVRLIPVYMWYWISIDILVCCLRAVGMVATTVCEIDVGTVSGCAMPLY